MAASRTTRKFRKQMRKTRRKGGKRGPPSRRSSSAQTFQLHDSTKNKCNPSRQEYYRRAWNDFQKRDNYRKINELIKKASTEDNENYAKLRDLYKKTKKNKKNKKGPPLDDILIDYDEPKTRGKVTCLEGDSPREKNSPKRRSSEFNFDLQYGKNPSISRSHTHENLRKMTPKEESDRYKRGESLLPLRKSSSPSLEEP